MKHALFALLLSSAFLTGMAQSLTGAGPVMVWPAVWLPGNPLRVEETDGPPLLFPADTPTDSLERLLPAGLYIVRRMAGSTHLTQSFLQVSPLHKAALVGTYPNLSLQLALNGLEPAQARVFAGETRLVFDTVNQVFNLPILKEKQAMPIRIEYPGGSFFLTLRHSQTREKQWVVSPEVEVISQNHRRDKKWKYAGYLMFSQPKYKPGDTLRYKIFLVNRRGKPMRDSLSLWLDQGADGLRREIRLAPGRPGAYSGELVLEPSLGVKLDRPIEGYLRHRGKYVPVHAQTQFEAYKLKEITWKVSSPENLPWRPDSTCTIRISALDPNGRPAPDATMKVTIALTAVNSINPAMDTVYVSRELFTYEGPVKDVELPASLHPGAETRYQALISLKNAANEIKTEVIVLTTHWSQPPPPAPPVRSLSDAVTDTRLSDSSLLKPAPGALKVAWEMPADTTPGAEVEIVVRVTDHLGKPVVGADVLSLGINAQMDNRPGFVAEMPHFDRPVPVDEIETAVRLEQETPEWRQPLQTGLSRTDLARMRVSDSAFYRLTWPVGLETLQLPLPKPGPMQVAPFIYHNGVQEPVLMIWAGDNAYEYNQQLVWHIWAGQPYSAQVGLMANSFILLVRTAHALYTIRNVPRRPDHKYLLSFDPENLPGNVTREEHPTHLTQGEADALNYSTVVLQRAYNISYPNGAPTQLWAWQDGLPTRIREVAGRTMLFPAAPNSTVQIAIPGLWHRYFTPTPGMQYTIHASVVEMAREPFFTTRTNLAFAAAQSLGDVWVDPPVYQEISLRQQADWATGRSGKGLVEPSGQPQGQYQIPHVIVGLYRPGDTTNLWLVPEANGLLGLSLPEGRYQMLLTNNQRRFAVQEIDIRKGFVCAGFVPDSAFRRNDSLAQRLKWGTGLAKGRWINGVIHWGPETVERRVVDFHTGQPLAGAMVLLVNEDGQLAGTTTDSLGHFSFSGISLEGCQVMLAKDGYWPAVTPFAGHDTLRMQPAPPSPDGYFQRYPCRFRLSPNKTLFFEVPAICAAGENAPACLLFTEVETRNAPRRINTLPKGWEQASQPYEGFGRAKPIEAWERLPTGTVTGTVWGSDGEPLAGAAIIVQGINHGVMSDVDGRYRLSVPAGERQLQVMYLGYRSVVLPVSVAAGGIYVLDVQMEEDMLQVDEVVVVAAGITPRLHNLSGVSVEFRERKRKGSPPPPPAPTILLKVPQSEVITDSLVGMPGDFPREVIDVIQLRTRFADCAWWQPLLVTDSLGEARFTIRLPDDITAWNGYALAMTAHKQAGIGKAVIRAHKPVEARLAVPDFLTTADTVLAIGRVLSHVPDSQAVTIHYGQSGDKPASRTATLSGSLVQPFAVAPNPGDTLVKARFTVSMPGQGGDGEERNIPIYPVGVKEAMGTLLTLEGDTSLVFTPTPNLVRHASLLTTGSSPKEGEQAVAPLPSGKGPGVGVTDSAYLSLSSDNLFPLLKQVEALRNYPYYCNEQASSKLAGLLAGRTIDSVLHRPNGDSAAIAKLVKKLCDGQNPSGLWGWFPGMSDHVWLSALILKRVYAANPGAACVPKALHALSNVLYTDTTLQQTVRIAVLSALAKTGFAMDYHTATDSIAVSATNLNALANLGALKASLGKPIDSELNTLLPAARKTFTGGLFWGTYSWDWYGNGWETTLQVYQMLRHSGDSTGRIRRQICRGVLEQTQAYSLNTLQAATLLATLLPDLAGNRSTLEPPTTTIDVAGKSIQVKDFPYQTRVPAGAPMRIAKTGISPVYLSYDQVFWNPAPNVCDSLFAVTTWLEQGGRRVDALRTGATAELVVRVQAHYSSSYLALDVPIPAGCIYAAKPQYHHATDCHREYAYHQTTIFMERLWTGEHTYRIPLEVRFGGSFVLNPARIHAMYMPHKQGFNGVKRVEVEQE